MQKSILKIIFLLLIIFNFRIEATAQKKITVVAKNRPLSSVLNKIEKETNLKFSYLTNQIKSEQKVSIIARRKSVKTVLKILFSGTDISYSFVEKQVILKPIFKKKQTSKPIKKVKEAEKITISGILKDSISGEVLIGATVSVKGKPIGVSTNGYGFYSLSLPKGNYVLVFSYIGFEKKYQEI